MNDRLVACAAVALLITGCNREADPPIPTVAETPQLPAAETIRLQGDWDARLDPEELERGRRDPSWTRVVELDTAGLAYSPAAEPESWDDISAERVNNSPMQLPLSSESEGPSVLRAQILLDRVLFSPGIIDGFWGKNTEKAAFWFQRREGLRETGRIDESTFERLVQLAGGETQLVRVHTLTQEDVEGPFVTIPEDIYEKAEMDCLCYESLSEKLAEMFHTSPELLAQLNPGISLDEATAGTQLNVLAVRSGEAAGGAVARLVVSGEGFFVHAVDGNGRILYHFPSTLGSSFDPSPTGRHQIDSITRDPWWHYQPSILEHVEDEDPEADIPPGPNNAVGVVWMALSLPHYGIHGTSAPETIGYTTSAGCVRLTNWDASFLADKVQEGTPVEFVATS